MAQIGCGWVPVSAEARLETVAPTLSTPHRSPVSSPHPTPAPSVFFRSRFPRAHPRCLSPSCNPGRGQGRGCAARAGSEAQVWWFSTAVPGAAAALRLRTLGWEAGSLGVLICKAAGGAGRGLEVMQMREAGPPRGSAPLPRSWGQRCQAQLDEPRQLGE